MNQNKQEQSSIVLNPTIVISKKREIEIWSVDATRKSWNMLESMSSFKKMCSTKEKEAQKKKDIMENATRLIAQEGMTFDRAMQKTINSYIKVLMDFEDATKR